MYKGAVIAKGQNTDLLATIDLPAQPPLDFGPREVLLVEPGIDTPPCAGPEAEFLVTADFADIFANHHFTMKFLKVCGFNAPRGK